MRDHEPKALDTDKSGNARHYYFCWPFAMGNWICGLSFVGIGLALVLQQFFPDAGEAIWGGILIAVGFVVLATASRQGDTW